MLAVPLKVSDVVDFITPLSSYISEKYTNISEESYTASLEALNELRKSALTPDTTSQDPNEQEKQRQKLYQYYAQLCSMQAKFPVSASSNDVKLSFKWKDAFKPSKSIMQHSLAYEKASILFNIGALYTLNGLNADASDGGYTKNAAKMFMFAAGVYSHLRNNVATRVGGALTSDLSQEGLQSKKFLIIG
jgi:programmed cell death 6-interacting protein